MVCATNGNDQFIKIVFEVYTGSVRTELINKIDVSMPHSRRFFNHLEILQEIYEAMREKTMVYKIEKSHLGFSGMKSLGHILSERRRMPDPKLVSKLLAVALPRDIQGVRSFLGILNFNREYVPNLLDILVTTRFNVQIRIIN